MDIMSIGSKMMKAVAGKALSLAIFRKLGYKMKIQVNEFEVKNQDGNVHAKLYLEADMTEEQLRYLLDDLGL